MAAERVALEGVVVLLVEDNPLVRRALARTLAAVGCTVVESPDAQDARRRLEEGFAPAVLLTDIRMAGDLDGIELARWAAAHRPAVRVLLQSGHTEATELPFPVLRKPFGLEELHDALTRLLGDSQRA